LRCYLSENLLFELAVFLNICLYAFLICLTMVFHKLVASNDLNKYGNVCTYFLLIHVLIIPSRSFHPVLKRFATFVQNLFISRLLSTNGNNKTHNAHFVRVRKIAKSDY
jgi:hypothetical protein